MSNYYFDNNATTCIAPEVELWISSEMGRLWGNPSSIHSKGAEAKTALIVARRGIAELLGVKPLELIFTSGATESIHAFLESSLKPGDHLVTSDLEHAALFEKAKALAEKGIDVTFLKGGRRGAVSVEEVESALTEKTKVIALMAANNETGVLTDLKEIAHLAEKRSVVLFVDATALIGKAPFPLYPGISAFCFSGHKFHAPKGVGALVVRSRVPFSPLFVGGAQEYGKRAGTENVLLISAMHKALELQYRSLGESEREMERLRDLFEKKICEALPHVTVNGEGKRVCNTSNLAFVGVDGESLLLSLDLSGVMASHGSACSSGSLEPSRVLLNMGLTPKEAKGSLRFSFSRYTTEQEIKEAAAILVSLVRAF